METINMVGKTCPVPVIEAKKALKQAVAGTEVRVLVDNDIARQNLSRMANKMGAGFGYEAQQDGNILVSITAPEASAVADEGEGLVVAIGRSVMGGGDDELGGMLMKSFIYSLTELDNPPETVLFFNGGVHLTAEGAATLDDLRALEEKGTVISSCGACLDFYKLKEKLAVGNVTNMYTIATTMAEASRLINQ